MPNILLTQKCVRTCPYCFAKKHMSDSFPDDIISWKNLIYIADLVEISGENHISLLGGEPTLHPDFIDIVIYLLERNFHITVFTSGVIENKKLEEMKKTFLNIPLDRLSFVCNLNDPKKSPLKEVESVKRFLEAFGEFIVPGFNIYKTDFDLDFLFYYINRYGLQRNIRLGMAHPIPKEKNLFIGINDIDKVINRLSTYLPKFERLRIKPGFDCGFPLCRFSDRQLGWLYRFTGNESKFGCGPAIDIGPDMTVWSCFPLSNFHKKSIFDFNSIQDIIDYYNDLHEKVRNEIGGIYEECDECNLRQERLCSGGCLAHLISRFIDEEPVRMQEVYL